MNVLRMAMIATERNPRDRTVKPLCAMRNDVRSVS
jgi:hypothetical protein